MKVLDASMTLAWLFPRLDAVEASLAQRAMDELDSASFLVPAIWYTEIASGILRGERARRVTPLGSEAFLAELGSASIIAELEGVALRQSLILSLARAHKLTAHDATYLELAIRTGATLYTFDQQLAAAARSAGVIVFGDLA